MNLIASTAERGAASAQKPRIRLNIARFWAGAHPNEIIRLLLPDLAPFYDFEISDAPDIVLYGPYSGPMPKGNYVKVFIGCENVRPIMSECDWAFGVLQESVMKNPRYMRLMRWGDDTNLLHKPKDWEDVLRKKSKFCVFLYSAKVPYRESFFRALSAYKHIDAPGRSMNNMPPIDPIPGTFDWNAKLEFLRAYKFVIAFENSSAPGYNTEKLSHAVQADCVPIYWGDPEIERSFNPKRFINAHDFLPYPRRILPRLPYRPHALKATGNPGFADRLARRVNGEFGELEQKLWARFGFEKLVEQVVRADKDDALYLSYLREPFLPGNRLPDRAAWIARWREIFANLPRR